MLLLWAVLGLLLAPICGYFEVPVEVVFSLSPFPRLGTESVPRSA